MYFGDFDTPITAPNTMISERGRRVCARSSTRMMPLEMHLHLTNGTTTRFVQPDPDLAESLLAALQPQRLFRKPQIVLASDDSLVTIPCSAIEQIVFLHHAMSSEWVLPTGIEDVVEFSPEALVSDPRRVGRGTETDWFLEFEMCSSRTICLWVRVNAVERHLPLDAGLAYGHLLDRPVVLGHRSEGGVFLLNPSNVVRVTARSSLRGVRSLEQGAREPAPMVGALPAGHCYR